MRLDGGDLTVSRGGDWALQYLILKYAYYIWNTARTKGALNCYEISSYYEINPKC